MWATMGPSSSGPGTCTTTGGALDSGPLAVLHRALPLMRFLPEERRELRPPTVGCSPPPPPLLLQVEVPLPASPPPPKMLPSVASEYIVQLPGVESSTEEAAPAVSDVVRPGVKSSISEAEASTTCIIGRFMSVVRVRFLLMRT